MRPSSTVARQRLPARERVADGLGQLGLGRDAAHHARCSQACSSSSSGPARAWRCSASHVRRLAPDLGLDRVQRGDAPQGLRGHRARRAPGAQVQIPPRSPRVGPASRFDDAPAVVELAPAAIGVGLQDAAEVLAGGPADARPCGRASTGTRPPARPWLPAGRSSRTYTHSRPVLVLPRPGSSTGTGVSSACTLAPASA